MAQLLNPDKLPLADAPPPSMTALPHLAATEVPPLTMTANPHPVATEHLSLRLPHPAA